MTMQAFFNVPITLEDVKNNPSLLNSFTITQKDNPLKNIFHIMIEFKCAQNVRFQIARGKVIAVYHDLNELHMAIRHWNSSFKDSEYHLINPYLVKKAEFTKIGFISEEDADRLASQIIIASFAPTYSDGKKYTIFVPTVTGYGWEPKEVSFEEYMKHYNIFEKTKRDILDNASKPERI